MNQQCQLLPYLNFSGNCEEAMNFYKSVLGGDLHISRFSEASDPSTPEDYKNKVMHSTLTNDVLSFMASDTRPGATVNFGDSVNLSLAGTDEALLTKYFNGLSEGGKVMMPLAKQFWGDTFGIFTDKFGINWMVNISAAKQ
ncbi:MAG TPA: VOC family protein [Candidatus Saccharimonadales bacterium]